MPHSHLEIQSWIVEELSSRLAEVFETMAGERPLAAWEISGAPSGDSLLRWSQSFSGVAGTLRITAREADWTTVARQVLRAAGIAESDPSSLQSTYLEMISQTLAGLAQSMSGRLGREVACASGEESESLGEHAAWASLRLKLGTAEASLGIGLEPDLLGAFCDESSTELAAAPTSFAGSKTFDLLLDVELPVSVSFGRAQVQLKDALKLTTGSIVELNRSITEPVEVIVNNCVIARGEVVVVDGNFGVRIQQVISRQERLRTLN